MDDLECDEAALSRTLEQFTTVNRLFSRYRTLLKQTILRDMEPGRDYHLVDMGAGGCDIPMWLLQEADARGLSLRITAVDSDPRITRFARERTVGVPALNVVTGNGLDLDEVAPFDYVFANHVLHHLPDGLIRSCIQKAHALADRGFVFSDLKRNRWSHLGFSIAALPFRKSFTRTDGLISIQRGFLPSELQQLAGTAPAKVLSLFPGRVNLVSAALLPAE